MGYVAVTAGEELIERAADLFEAQARGEEPSISPGQVEDQLGRLTAQVMGEAGLYAPRLAAMAVQQAQGDTVEAAFLLRAYRSTLSRWDETRPISTDELFTTRRVSPAFKDVPGGQILGPTKDYTQRLLDFEREGAEGKEASTPDPTAEWDLTDGADGAVPGTGPTDPEWDDVDSDQPTGKNRRSDHEPAPDGTLRNVMAVLRDEGLVPDPDPPDVDEPTDTTRTSVTSPIERDAVLQELARGETGAVTALGYSALRGYGQVHPTLAEVRVGRLPVRITHPYTGEPAAVAECTVTESEAIVPVYAKRDDPQFAFGYGLTFGRNERKAIGMTILDASIQLESEAEPAEDPEFVLDVIDGMDAFGFIEHLKLPHYVTFQSILDRIRSIRERVHREGDRPDHETGQTNSTARRPEDEPPPSNRTAAPEVSDDD